jgi:hypothetical protein
LRCPDFWEAQPLPLKKEQRVICEKGPAGTAQIPGKSQKGRKNKTKGIPNYSRSKCESTLPRQPGCDLEAIRHT